MNERMKEDGKTERGCILVGIKKRKERKKETPWTRFLLRWLILAFHSRISVSLMESVGSLPSSQESATGPCPELDNFTPSHPL
jgi:hypothetical protein